MDFVLTKPQSEFFHSTAKYTAAVAGFGSGKTEVAMIRMLSNMMTCPGIDQAYLAPSYPLIRDIWYPKIEDFLTEMGVRYHINRAEHTIHLADLGRILCRTMDKPETIVGWSVGDAFLDELDVLPTDKALHVVRKVTARLRQKKQSKGRNQLFVTTTPEGFKATYQMFKKKPLKDSKLVQMSTFSNQENLDDEYIETLFDQYPEQLKKAYLMGEFVNLTEGAVYPEFDRKLNSTHYVARPREQLHIGMDFNVYKMAATIHVIRKNKAYAVDEFTNVNDTPTITKLINDRYSDHDIVVYPDATGGSKSSTGASVSDIRILQSGGFRVVSPKKNPFIKDRVNSFNNRLCDPRGERHYFVNVDKCPTITDCLEQQIYDANGTPDKSNNMDHSPDSAGYFVHKRWPLDGFRAMRKSGNWK